MINYINWYPGHMKKTKELIKDNLKAVDLAIEIVDSRIPLSSRNPIIDDLVGKKQRVIILGKPDLSDIFETEKWEIYFKNKADYVVCVDSKSGHGIKKFFSILEKIQKERNTERKIKKPLRMMIVGVPNVGKSSFINRLTGKKSTKTGDKPGVTKGKQWITLKNGMQLLDTPGILWPKFENQKVGLNLAFCGSIKDEILDTQDLAFELIKVLEKKYPENLKNRYKLDVISENTLENMEAIAKKRGFILSGKRFDYERTGRTVLDEFRAGLLGNITLETVGDKVYD